MTSRGGGTPRGDVIVVTSRGGTPGDWGTTTTISTSPAASSSMPHLGPDNADTIQPPPLNHIYRSSSAALTGRHGDDAEAVAMATTKRWRAGRQGRHHGAVTSRDYVTSAEHCYWSCLSARNLSRHAILRAFYRYMHATLMLQA